MNKALTDLPGVSAADVQVGTAKVTFDPSVTDLEKMKVAIYDAGYDLIGAE